MDITNTIPNWCGRGQRRPLGRLRGTVVAFTHRSSVAAPDAQDLACLGPSPTGVAPRAARTGCDVLVLARLSRSLDAFDARVTLGAVCAGAGTTVAAPNIEMADLDGDGRLEVAVSYGAALTVAVLRAPPAP